jgi:hypothetical protein
MIVQANVIEIRYFFRCYGLYQDIIPIEKRDGAEDEICSTPQNVEFLELMHPEDTGSPGLGVQALRFSRPAP